MPKLSIDPTVNYKSLGSENDFNLDEIYDFIFNDVYAIITEVDEQ